MNGARSGKVVNKRGLAEIFGVSVQAVDGWLTRGCPYLEKGAPLSGYKFDTAQVAEWRSQRAVDEAIGASKPANQDDAAQRKLAADATRAELKLHRELGQLVTLEEVERVWGRLTAACRSRLLGVPSKVAAIVVSAPSADQAREIIESSISEALDELGAAGIDEPDGAESAVSTGGTTDNSPETAPAVDSQRVGRRKAKAKSGSKR